VASNARVPQLVGFIACELATEALLTVHGH